MIQPRPVGYHVFQWRGQLLESSEKRFLVFHEMDYDICFLPLNSNRPGCDARDGHCPEGEDGVYREEVRAERGVGN